MPVTTTYLEMLEASQLRPKSGGDPRFRVQEATLPQWQFNRFLYTAVGSNWEWTLRREWDEAQWRQYAESPATRTFGAYYDGSPAGYYELRRDEADGVELAYFGLMPAFIGRGFGGALLSDALTVAWAMGPNRVWVHTCTLDHPAALPNYLARGMTVYRVETTAA